MPQKTPKTDQSGTVPQTDELGTDATGIHGKKITRTELERMSSELVRILHKRATARRFKPSPDTDSPRLQYARATIAALQVYGGILKDGEIEDLEKRISEIERTARGDPDGKY
jgi:hypothetical protein